MKRLLVAAVAATALTTGTVAVTAAPAEATTVIAHRGYHAEGISGNSLGAFRGTWNHQIRCAETDMRLTIDGRMVLVHDSKLEHTTDGEGPVEESTFEYVRSLHLDDGQRVPTFGEAVRLAARKHGCLFVELKGGYWYHQEYLQAIQTTVVNHGMENLVRMYSSRKGVLTNIEKHAPALWAVWKMHNETQMPSQALVQSMGLEGIVPRGFTTAKGIKRMHEIGVKVYRSLIESPRGWRKCVEMKCDGFLTNRPIAARDWLRSH